MKAHGIRLILGLIAATVIAADEQGFHLHGMNKADNQGFGALMGKPARGAHQRSFTTVPTGSPHMDFDRPTMVRECTSFSRTRMLSPCWITMGLRSGTHPSKPGSAGDSLSAWCSRQRGESRATREPAGVGDSSHGGQRRREEWDYRPVSRSDVFLGRTGVESHT